MTSHSRHLHATGQASAADKATATVRVTAAGRMIAGQTIVDPMAADPTIAGQAIAAGRMTAAVPMIVGLTIADLMILGQATTDQAIAIMTATKTGRGTETWDDPALRAEAQASRATIVNSAHVPKSSNCF